MDAFAKVVKCETKYFEDEKGVEGEENLDFITKTLVLGKFIFFLFTMNMIPVLISFKNLFQSYVMQFTTKVQTYLYK